MTTRALVTIALVPTPEWREALLGDGPCGSRAPALAVGGILQAYELIPIEHRADRRPTIQLALPLLWEGKPVPDGIARAVAAWAALKQADPVMAYVTRYERGSRQDIDRWIALEDESSTIDTIDMSRRVSRKDWLSTHGPWLECFAWHMRYTLGIAAEVITEEAP